MLQTNPPINNTLKENIKFNRDKLQNTLYQVTGGMSPEQTQAVLQLVIEIKETTVCFCFGFFFYLCRCWRKVLSLSLPLLFSDALACGSVRAGVCFHCVRVNACICGWASEYANAWVPSLNAQPFPLSASVWMRGRERLRVRVCADLRAECRPKHKSGSFPVSFLQPCQRLPHCSSAPPRTQHSHHRQVDYEWYVHAPTYTHTHSRACFYPDWCEGANVRGRGLRIL